MEIREDLCTGCGLCTRVCPSGAISLKFGKPLIDFGKCIGCLACSSICPNHAIQPIYFGNLGDLRKRLHDLNRRIHWVSGRLDGLAAGYRRGE